MVVLLDRAFWSKVDTAGAIPDYAPHLGRCWIWSAAMNPKGYGRFRYGGRLWLAHRLLYIVKRGPLPADRSQLDHLCRVPACVNPAHLEPVTCSENVMRGVWPRQVSERAAAVTHCKHGHEFTEANTRLYPGRIRVDGQPYMQRQCVECGRIAVRRRRAVKRSAVHLAH